ncbi:MAG: hypothetical protein H6815_03850 [Phycisphaeraceae bacterium]|nr:hypothetical protein [Phycisphaerales bacterium]MCB9859563.1 hypothetical protein [Phycisphaeraceae bacterium]
MSCVALFCCSAAAQNCTSTALPIPQDFSTNGTVYELGIWDPDNDGSQNEMLVVGGSFTSVGKQPIASLALWDGELWHQIGFGSPIPQVERLGVYEGNLFVSGLVSGFLAETWRWDGTSWHYVPVPTPLGIATCFLQYQGRFFVASSDLQSEVTSFWQWENQAWVPAQGGSVYSTINIFREYKGKLFAGGGSASLWNTGGVKVNGIAEWNGEYWTHPGFGIPRFTNITALGTHQSKLFFGGTALPISTFDGHNVQQLPGSTQSAYAFHSHEDVMLAGGRFQEGILLWDGVAWQSIFGGISSSTTPTSSVIDMLEWDGMIILAGTFDTAFGNPAGNLALLDISCLCAPDCDQNAVLNIFDYICFGNAYASMDPYADCDKNGFFNVFDYICFGNAYANGCP